jgi:hypothetical protein
LQVIADPLVRPAAAPYLATVSRARQIVGPVAPHESTGEVARKGEVSVGK